MARAKYQITANDVLFAKDYLLRALKRSNYQVKEPGAHKFQEFLLLVGDDLKHDAYLLNKWCESCLNSEQWQKLKTSIRKRRYLADNKDVAITLKPDAHQALLAIIESGVASTLSEAILYLAQNQRLS